MAITNREFLHTVLPESGFVVIGRLAPQKGSPFQHDVYDSIDKALDVLEHPDTVFTKQNYYFCVSTLAERSVVERGKLRVRTQSNAKYTRCILLDVDIKSDERYYATKEEAWEGIKRVSAQLNMPEPIIVDSGFGYHVYWPMAAGVPSKEWQSATKLFYQALSIVEPKAVADASRVSDSAGVLRIPGTYNLKFGQQTPVEIVQEHTDFLDFGTFRETLARITGISSNGPTVNLTQGERVYEKAPLVGTIKNCNWAKEYMLNQATASEPAWYGMLGMAAFLEHTTKEGETVSGVAIAHLLSKGHPDYSQDATNAKYNQVVLAQSGPTTCAKLQQINPEPCKTCPFAGAVKSPVSTARLSRPAKDNVTVVTAVTDDEGNKAQEQVTIPRPPAPYFRGEDGGVFIRVKEQNEEGAWNETIKRVYDYDLYPVKRFRSELKEEEQIEIHLWLPKDGVRRFKMPAELLADHKKLAVFLTSRGAVGETGSSQRMAKYMVDYTRYMQTESTAEVEYSRFGWRDINSDSPKFVVGNGYVDKDGVLHPAAFPNFLRSAATAVAAHGDLNKWKEGFNVYNKIPNSEAFIFTALIGFAAPGMALTPYAGVLYNMVGDTAAGKSSALALMTSVWGMPMPARIKIDDTAIATFNTIGYLNSVPVAFDEATNMEPMLASQFALNFTGGRGKDRAGRDGQNKDNNIEWDTIVACSSNTSLYSKFNQARKGYNAETMRLFEIPVPHSNLKYRPLMEQANAIINANYGLAGRAFIPSVMVHKKVLAKLIADKTEDILTQIGGTNAERFWATLVANVLVLGGLAKKLGLHDYDMKTLETWALSQMKMVRVDTTRQMGDAISYLGEFINSNLDGMIRVRDGSVDLKVNITQPRNIKGRLEYTGDSITKIMISAKAFNDFCNTNRIDPGWIMTELKRANICNGNSRPARLASGTNFPNPSVRVYDIDYNLQIEEAENEQRTNEPEDGTTVSF